MSRRFEFGLFSVSFFIGILIVYKSTLSFAHLMWKSFIKLSRNFFLFNTLRYIGLQTDWLWDLPLHWILLHWRTIYTYDDDDEWSCLTNHMQFGAPCLNAFAHANVLSAAFKVDFFYTFELRVLRKDSFSMLFRFKNRLRIFWYLHNQVFIR